MGTGKVVQVIGTVIDVEFAPDELPKLFDALEADNRGEKLVLEVQQHIGNNWVRCLALGSTDGLGRGVDVVDTSQMVMVPVGPETLGRLFDVTGTPLDNLGPVESGQHWPIHREPPGFDEQNPSVDILETGIKVFDLITPFMKGGKIGAYGGSGGWQDRYHPGTHQEHRCCTSRSVGLCGSGRTFSGRQRPMEGNASIWGSIQYGAGVRPDERDAGGAARVGLTGLTMSEYFRDEKSKMCCFSSTTSTATSWQVWKCRHCWDECRPPWAISPPWVPRWVRYRSESLPLKVGPLPRSRRSTYPPTTTPTLAL